MHARNIVKSELTDRLKMRKKTTGKSSLPQPFKSRRAKRWLPLTEIGHSVQKAKKTKQEVKDLTEKLFLKTKEQET